MNCSGRSWKPRRKNPKSNAGPSPLHDAIKDLSALTVPQLHVLSCRQSFDECTLTGTMLYITSQPSEMSLNEQFRNSVSNLPLTALRAFGSFANFRLSLSPALHDKEHEASSPGCQGFETASRKAELPNPSLELERRLL